MVPDSKHLFWVKSGQRSTKSKRLRKYSKDKPPISSHLRPLPSHCISIETSSYGKFFLTGEALFDGRGPNSGLCWFPCAMMLLATLWRLPANTHSTLCRHSCKTPVKAQRPFVSIPTNLRIASDDLAKAGLNGLSVFPVLSHFWIIIKKIFIG